MKLEDIMKPPIHVDKDQRLSYAVDMFKKHNIARLPVINEGELVGIITQRDILQKVGNFKEDVKMSTFHISTCMTKYPFVLHPHDTVKTAILEFCERGISGIPIVDEGLMGIVTKLDIIKIHEYDTAVTTYCNPNFLSVSMDERVVHVRMLMLDNNVRCLPVINGKLGGVITTSDVVFELYKFMEFVEKHQSTIARNLPVNEAMNQNPETVTLGEDMETVKETMVEGNLSTLIVVNDVEDVVGLISKDEMVQGLISQYT
ncbi:MAG: CBS domain-containing protein [Candidatus Methanofastidiosia archaeon]|jgi:CBS domain-containing protein